MDGVKKYSMEKDFEAFIYCDKVSQYRPLFVTVSALYPKYH